MLEKPWFEVGDTVIGCRRGIECVVIRRVHIDNDKISGYFYEVKSEESEEVTNAPLHPEDSFIEPGTIGTIVYSEGIERLKIWDGDKFVSAYEFVPALVAENIRLRGVKAEEDTDV